MTNGTITIMRTTGIARLIVGGCLALLISFPAYLPAAQAVENRWFSIHTDDFWLNLHHYLYVLARAHNGTSDASQPAVAGVLEDEQQGLATVSDEERSAWNAAVMTYQEGLGRQNSFFQAPLAPITLSFANTGDVPTLPASPLDAASGAALERAAPIYRKHWWARHHAMNVSYVTRLQQQMQRDGLAVAAFLSKVYGLEWPERPYPTHVVAFANWQGAFSYTGRLLVLSSNNNTTNDRFYPLESAFHEGMHQWDDRVQRALEEQAKALGVSVPEDLSHILVFVTVGESVRRLHPEHVPFIDALNLWQGTLSGSRVPASRLHSVIQQYWMPYLYGRGARDEALRAILGAAAGMP